MTTLLRLDCSPHGAAAHSRRLGDLVEQRLAARHGSLTVVRRALGEQPASLVDAAYARDMIANPRAETARQVASLQESERLIGELEGADLVLIATPMHNFTVPAALKAWLDQVVRVGRTFRSTPEGKIGLLDDRPVHVVATSGGYFLPPRARQPDFLTPYLAAILATIGLKDVRHYPAEGLSRGEAAVAEAYADVARRIDEHLGPA